MIRRTIAALLLAASLIAGFVAGTAGRADASQYKPCVYVWYVLSGTPMRLCVPLIVVD